MLYIRHEVIEEFTYEDSPTWLWNLIPNNTAGA